FEYRDVFEEGGPDLLDQHVRRLRITDVEVVRLAPEIVARGLGFRRDGVEIPHADAADALALPRPGAGRRGADVEAQERRRGEIDDLPAVHVGGEAARLHEGRRRRRIDHPAGDRDTVLRALHLDLRLVYQRRIPDRGSVHEGEMGEVEQVVDDELPVAFDVEVFALGAPVRIVEPVEIG